jgi:hypothetical protein
MLLCVYHNNLSTLSSIIYSLGIKGCYIHIWPTGMFPMSLVLSSGFCVISNLHVCKRTQQDGQCTYKITLRYVRITIVAVGSKYYIFRMYVCSLSYPACTVHAQYYIVICGLSASTIFFHILSNGIFSDKKLLYI